MPNTQSYTVRTVTDVGTHVQNKLTHTLTPMSTVPATHPSASQEIPRILQNLKVHYRAHSSPSNALSLARGIQSMPSQPISLKMHSL